MSYNAEQKARVKDLKSLALRMTAITSDLTGRVSDLEILAQKILEVMNSIIANIEERND